MKSKQGELAKHFSLKIILTDKILISCFKLLSQAIHNISYLTAYLPPRSLYDSLT